MSVVKLANKQWWYGGLTLALLCCGLILYSAYHGIQRSQSVARVNGQYISLEEYETRRDFRLSFLESQDQAVNEDVVAADIYQRVIDDTLITQYGRGQGLSVEEAEIDARIERTRQQLGEEEFERRLAELYDDEPAPYREVIRADLMREKVSDDLEDTSLAEWLADARSDARIQRYTD